MTAIPTALTWFLLFGQLSVDFDGQQYKVLFFKEFDKTKVPFIVLLLAVLVFVLCCMIFQLAYWR